MAKAYLTIAVISKEHNVHRYTEMRREPQIMYDSAAYWAGKVVRDYKNVYDFDANLRDIYDVDQTHGARAYLHHADRSAAVRRRVTTPNCPCFSCRRTTPYRSTSVTAMVTCSGPTATVGVFSSVMTEFVETQFSTTDKRRTELIHRDIYDASGNPIVPNQVKGYFSSKYVDPDFIGERTSARPYLIRFSDIALVYAEAAGPEAAWPM